ncbi:hypothetical protein B7494_g7437 [Chlorociboria aeruginascens]|nr:hypothetical protein B7494_g7437 [Chlorociboria aeruginascens]
MVRSFKETPPRKPNNIRGMKEIQAPLPPIYRNRPAKPAKRACPNKECSAPRVEDGVCHNCGTVVDDSNIVAEVQFGESSSGAAVVQGSFVSADQGAAKSMGPAFRRAGGSEDRETTIREGRRTMQALAVQLRISESVVNSGVQIFKLAAMHNFIQGRRMDMVVAVCLYSACRKEKPCRVMLIDFADKTEVNVFKLGHTFKALHSAITLAKDGILPVLPEDLIYRFAMKLEFGDLTHKVAEDAVRMVQRMSLDWMVMGRRPSGVCGACLILAARMNNFRRTVTEVVYIVKVTTHTIQKRLDEFKLTPSSALTVEEFLNNEFLESAHDPPSFYEKSEEFIKAKEARKRKRRGLDEDEDEDGEDGENGDEEGNGQNSTQETAGANDGQNSPKPGDPLLAVELRRDADGFAIPRIPNQESQIDPRLLNEEIDERSGLSITSLVQQFGDQLGEQDDEIDAELEAAVPSAPKRAPKHNQAVHVPEEWHNSEVRLESEISEMINDPQTSEHAISYAKAAKLAEQHMIIARANEPDRNISMDVNVGEDEFADDPEVANCLLNEVESLKKEKVWVNANKDWLRKKQVQEYQKKIADQGPKKATRHRKKKPRIGELQTSAASSPAEAAINALKQRTWSKKINYDAINKMLSLSNNGSMLGSAATSCVTSRAPSTVPESPSAPVSVSNSRAGSVIPEDRNASQTPVPRTGNAETDVAESLIDEDYEQESVVAEAEAVDDWRADFRNGDEDEDEEMEDEVEALDFGEINYED